MLSYYLSGAWTNLDGKIKAEPNPVNVMLRLNPPGMCNLLFSLRGRSCKEHIIFSLYANKHYKY